MNPNLHIQHGLPESLRRRAAELYYEAFRQKLAPIFGSSEKGIRILQADLVLQYAIVALREGRLVGIAGLQYGGGHLVRLRLATFYKHLGIAGVGRFLLAALLSRSQRPGELLMDGIVVDAAVRGRGVGSQLLDAVVDFASVRGFNTVRLDVVDTNPDARRLYERKGFMPIKTHRYGALTRWMGFEGATTMQRMVG